MTIHYFIILLRRAVFLKSSFVAGNPKIPFLIPRNPYVLKRCQARKQTTASVRILLQYAQFPDHNFRNFSRDIGIFPCILQFSRIYSTIHSRTTNDVLRNPGWEAGPYSKRRWWLFYFIFACRHIVTDCSKLKVRHSCGLQWYTFLELQCVLVKYFHMRGKNNPTESWACSVSLSRKEVQWCLG